MLKRFFAVFCILALLSTLCIVPATAAGGQYAPTVAVSKTNPDVISISGTAPENAGVTLTILNPGKTLSSLQYDDDLLNDAIAYADVMTATNGSYAFNALLLQNRTDAAAIGGTFTIVVNILGADEVYTSEFEFYYRAAKFNVIAEFNQKADSVVLEKCMQLYSLQDNRRWTNGEPQKVLTALINIKASLSGQQFPETGETAPVLFAGYLQQALLTAALNSGKAELISDTDGIQSDLLGYFDKNAVADYRAAINSAGRNKVLSSLLAGNYRLMQDASDSFSCAVAFSVIASNVKQGYGHVDSCLASYKDIYQSAGFDMAAYDSLSKNKTNQNKFLSAFMQGSFSDLDEMKKVFNETLKTYNKSGGSGGGSGSGGSGSGGSGSGGSGGNGKTSSNTTGSAGLIVPEVIPPCPFEDIAAVPWAKEAVSVLYDKNIIAGYNEKEYHPNDSVTRAEFTKLIMELGDIGETEEPATEENEVIRIATLGDSLTEGAFGGNGNFSSLCSYSEYLQAALGEGYEVTNFGHSSCGLYDKHQYPYRGTEEYKAALAYNPNIVLVFFGTNDAKIQYWDTIRAQYEDIYKNFVQEFTRLKSKPKVIVSLPTPVFGDSNYAKDRPSENMNELRDIITKLANDMGWKLVNSYALLAHSENLFPDGLHYNEKGAQILANAFAKAVRELESASTESGDVRFDDVADGDWFAPYVIKAASKEIVKGSDSLFRPNDTITRQDASVILYRMLGEKMMFENTASFTDDALISDYAKDAVAYLAGLKIINGMNDGSFQPNGILTRAQAAVLVYASYRALNQ